MFNLFRKRGFEVVTDKEGTIPTRSDNRSAGYDFYSPVDMIIQPKSQVLIFSNIKAYMKSNEVLKIYVRSSIGIKKGLRLPNQVGIIDSSYYNNPDNEGNIGICLYNSTDKTVIIQAGDRVAQGIFQKYLKADNDRPTSKKRLGGIGKSGR